MPPLCGHEGMNNSTSTAKIWHNVPRVEIQNSAFLLRFEVLKALTPTITFFWDVMCVLSYLFYHEDVSKKFLRSSGNDLPGYMVAYLQYFSYTEIIYYSGLGIAGDDLQP
jgi:hypothetical protein